MYDKISLHLWRSIFFSKQTGALIYRTYRTIDPIASMRMTYLPTHEWLILHGQLVGIPIPYMDSEMKLGNVCRCL